MTATSIEWADAVWNPVTGCQKVSPGCANCYAEGIARRFWDHQYPFWPMRPRRFTDVATHPDRLDTPLRWRKPRRVFVNSMSDLFHEDVPDSFVLEVFDVMRKCLHLRGHTFLVLTKRPARMLDLLPRLRFDGSANDGSGRTWFADEHGKRGGYAMMGGLPGCSPLANVWLGVSAENQATADERIPLLLQTPAAVRFVSCEPLLGPTDLLDYIPDTLDGHPDPRGGPWIDWIIVGGESGPKARPTIPEWFDDLVRQGREHGVPVFVKQVGTTAAKALGYKSRKGADPSEWLEKLRVRELPR